MCAAFEFNACICVWQAERLKQQAEEAKAKVQCNHWCFTLWSWTDLRTMSQAELAKKEREEMEKKEKEKREKAEREEEEAVHGLVLVSFFFFTSR